MSTELSSQLHPVANARGVRNEKFVHIAEDDVAGPGHLPVQAVVEGQGLPPDPDPVADERRKRPVQDLDAAAMSLAAAARRGVVAKYRAGRCRGVKLVHNDAIRSEYERQLYTPHTRLVVKLWTLTPFLVLKVHLVKDDNNIANTGIITHNGQASATKHSDRMAVSGANG